MDKLLEDDLISLRCQTDTKVLRMAVETLITIHRNIKQNAENPKYRRIKTKNEAFFNKIWRYKPAANFLQHSGWTPVSDDWNEIVYDDDSSLDLTLQVLLKNRIITPSVDEWNENTKLEGKSQEQLREEELKRKAIEERDKELAEFFKDQKERAAIAAYVKAEHKADRDRLRCLRNKRVGTDENEHQDTKH